MREERRMSVKNGPHLPHYHNAIKSTNDSAVYTPSTSIISDPLTDNYTVGETIGRGKFAVVKKCTNQQTGEVLAAKFIKKRRRGKSCREDILREVVMLEMALDHPRLVNLKEVYETQQELILITEYCAGGELFTECILEEKFDESDVRLLMSQILEGLVYLHEKNIVHLDLKPQNILLTDEFPQGSVKICDLGFACLVNTGEDIRDIIGTPDYVAPEVLNYDPLGLYTDMWSLGVLTYVMLTTCSPFAGEDKQMTFSNITTVNLDFPDDLFGDISMAAQDFIKKLLLAEPSERMTAKECFDHEWLSGIINPSKSLTVHSDVTPDLTTGEIKDIGVKVNIEGKDEVLKQSRGLSREKIENQTSEMSVNEGRDDEGVFVDTEPDLLAHNELDVSSNLTDVGTNTYELGVNPVENTAHKQNIHANVPVIKDEILNTNNVSSSDVTPDTDSSMCISESRLQDVDSGMVTGTESVDISGRTSVDQEPDADFNSETNEDIEMMNKSCIESELKDGVTNVSAISEKHDPNKTDISEIGNEKSEDIQHSIDEIASENEMDIEMSESCDNTKVLQINENNSANINNKQHSKVEDSSLCIPNEMISSQHRTSAKETRTQTPSQSNSDAKGRSSVSHIDDSINSMQLGESLKRGMCNDLSSPGAENPENDEQDYEFVSVSKRVRSYEDNITLTKSPPYSPKIARSPRIGRHSRPHHHQHH